MKFFENYKSILMKIAIIVWLTLLVIFAKLFTDYREQKSVIEMYNKGNNCYTSMGLYDVAGIYYDIADAYDPTEEQICSIHINKALSMVKPLTPEYINQDNIKDVLETLESARDTLCSDGCANMYDDNGHSEEAQTLKNEIDDYIEQLKKEYDVEQQDEPDEEKDKEQDTKEEDEQQKLRETFEDIQRQGMEERSRELDRSEASKHYGGFYDGKSW